MLKDDGKLNWLGQPDHDRERDHNDGHDDNDDDDDDDDARRENVFPINSQSSVLRGRKWGEPRL